MTYLVYFGQPVLVGRQLGHEGLMLQPFAVEVPGLVVRRVLSCQHLLVDPHGELRQREEGLSAGSFLKLGKSWERQHV